MRITYYDTRLDNEKHPYLVKERGYNYQCENINRPGQLVSMMNEFFHMDVLAEEHFYIIALNSKGSILGVFLISKGTVNASLVGTREVFIKLLLCGAVSFIATHNHPSGNVLPSSSDTDITNKLKEAGRLMEIQLSDHIIIGRHGYYSFLENEIL